VLSRSPGFVGVSLYLHSHYEGDRMTLTMANWSTSRTAFPSVILSTLNLTWTYLGSNSDFVSLKHGFNMRNFQNSVSLRQRTKSSSTREDRQIDMPAVSRRTVVCSIIRNVNYVGKLPNISTLRQMVGLHALTTVFYTVKWSYARSFFSNSTFVKAEYVVLLIIISLHLLWINLLLCL